MKQQIVDSHCIWYMSRLKDKFVKTVRLIGNEDASTYITFLLRNRLKKRFPQLVFHTTNLRNKNKFVFVEDLSRESVVERLLTSKNDRHSDASEDHVEEEDGLSGYKQTFNKTTKTIELKDLYVVALALRENIREYCSQ